MEEIKEASRLCSSSGNSNFPKGLLYLWSTARSNIYRMRQDQNYNFKSDGDLSGFLQVCGSHYSMIKQWCCVRSKYLSYLCQSEATCIINSPPLFLSYKTKPSFHLKFTRILTWEATLH